MQVNFINRDLDCNKGRRVYPAANNIAFGKIIKNNVADILEIGKNGKIKDGFLCVVSGPSGVGKDSVLNAFGEKYNFFKRLVTCTTRKMRPGEQEGVSYHFLTADEFKKGIQGGEFLEYNNVYADTYYGSRKRDIEASLASGNNVVLAVDAEGAMNIKKERPDALLLFIAPPSMDALASRLIKRGTETLQAITERLSRASYELSFKEKYDVILRNDDLAESVEEMAEIFRVK